MIKHSKLKNTGILFELLVRQVTADTLSGKESKALPILKKYFGKTELGREYKLYESLIKNNNLSEGKANIVINTILENAKNLNRTILKRQKYNLIKEIKENFDIEKFFKTKLNNYKAQASIYILFEINNNPNFSSQEIDNKLTLLEHLTSKKQELNKNKQNEVIEEFNKCDKDTKILTYRILLEKFNEKYVGLGNEQKLILREFINSVDNLPKLKEFYNNKIEEQKKELTILNKSTKNQVTKIKLNEVINIMNKLSKTDKINDDNMLNLLQNCELINELRKVNG